MEVLNLAICALFNALEKNNIDKTLLLAGTGLSMDEVSNLKKKHSWDQFVKMYDNCAKYLGYDVVAHEIAYTGIYNDQISLLRKVARSIVDAKSLYWYTSSFVAKHLYKKAVIFKCKKISSNHLRIEIEINSEIKDCPLLLETYIYLFERLPNLLGLPKARVNAVITNRKCEYDIYLTQTTIFKVISNKITEMFKKDASAIALMEQLEAQSDEFSTVLDEKSRLLQIVSHDVLNQVIIINFYTNKLLESHSLSDDDFKSLKILNSSSSKLTNILKNVQNMEIASARGLNLVPVDLEKVFQHVFEDFEPQLVQKNIKLVCKNQLPQGVFVMAEMASMESNLLGNLMSNAIKFSPEGSTIELQAILDKDCVFISVKDQGVGIAPDDRESIFVKRIRKSSYGTRGESGTGFGLGIVTKYVRLFNGKIKIEANEPAGTVFTVELKAYR